MTTEEKIHIAASFDSEKIKMIRELMKDSWDAAQQNALEVITNIKKAKGEVPIYVKVPFNPTKIQ